MITLGAWLPLSETPGAKWYRHVEQLVATETQLWWCNYGSGGLKCVWFIPLQPLFGGEINQARHHRQTKGRTSKFCDLVKRQIKLPPPLCIACQISIVGGYEDDLAWTLCFEIWTPTAPAPSRLWQVPLRDFAVLTRSSRCVLKEINPWWVAEVGETRSLVSGSDWALKLGVGSSWTRREEWRCTLTDSMTMLLPEGY